MACEKCWADAYHYPGDHSDNYHQLLENRFRTCTPEEQCGVGTTEMHTIYDGCTTCLCGQRSNTEVSHGV